MEPTKKQSQAIDTRGKNVLVSAAAGSGKTSVLTKRIIKLITQDKVPLKNFLVATFTEAAAKEMKARISKVLTAEAENNTFAEAQLRQLGSAKITTMHAFCLKILKRYYYKIDLDPSFQTIDEKRAEALKEDALDEMMAAAFAEETPEFKGRFLDFLTSYSSERDERAVREKILKVHDFILTLPEPFAWLREKVETLSLPQDELFKAPALRYLTDKLTDRFETTVMLINSVGELLDAYGLKNLAAKNRIDLETVTDVCERFAAGDFEGTRNLLKDIKFETFRATSDEKENFETIKGLIKKRRDKVKSILKEEVRKSFFARPESEYAGEINRVAPYARMLEELVIRFAKSYERIKHDEKVIDFADYEHMALKILSDDAVAEDYRKRLKYIFIDEYQDSNRVQEALISRIAGTDNVFMVGDVKQSIYGFRNAVPDIFLERYRSFPCEEEEIDPKNIRIDLSHNFRSSKTVINAVNTVFEVIMEERYSGMVYDENARLVQGLSYDFASEGTPCLHLPDASEKVFLHLLSKDKDKEFFGSVDEGEAVTCAKIIKSIVGRSFYDAQEKIVRPIKYSDIAILLRKAAGTADIYRRTLEEYGIPAFTDRGEGYFETIEIDTFLSLLQAIVNLREDVPLTAALCSAVFGFELPELASLRISKVDGSFYSAFLSYAEGGEDASLREKCRNTIELLAAWRDEERFMRLDDFLWKLLRESGFYDYAGTLAHGEVRQGNLRALLDRAAAYQNGRIDGLRGFLGYLEKIRLGGSEPQANLLLENEDICRIMTIHGSKGLEFPVVIMGGLEKSLTAAGNRDDSLMLHRDGGLSLYLEDHRTHTYKKTLLHSAIKLWQRVDERAEAIRLFYVAMTRAKSALHLIGTKDEPEALCELFGLAEADPADDIDVIGGRSYLDLILPVAVNHSEHFDIVFHESSLLAAETLGMKTAGVLRKDGAGTEEPEDGGGIRAGFVYPHADSSRLKSKYSVTELGKSRREGAPAFFMTGSWGEENEDAGLTMAERGTILHKALERMDFGAALAHKNDADWFDVLAERTGISSGEKDEKSTVLSSAVLQKFANSDLCRRAVSAKLLLKEVPFNMKMPYQEALAAAGGDIGGDGLPDEEIVVQGIIDCLFEEEDGLVIADYKSGRFDPSSLDAESDRIRSEYGAQLRLYRRAAELIFEKPVKEAFIYMTNSGTIIPIEQK